MHPAPSRLLAALALGMSVAGAAWAQEGQQTLQRATRLEESRQKGVASLTVRTVKELASLADEYQYNRIAKDGQVDALKRLSQALTRMADPNTPQGTRNMPWVAGRLASARDIQELSAIRKELLAASEGQDEIIAELTRLLASTKSQFNVGAQSDLNQVVEAQKQVMEQTQQLAEATLGKKAEELTPEQKAETDKLASKQEAVKEELATAVESLKQQAEEMKASAPEQAAAIEKALEELTKEQVAEKIDDAAGAVEENQLLAAQEQQQQVLDALAEAQQELAAQSPPDSAAAQLEQDLAQVGNMIEKQQELLDAAQGLQQQSPQQDFNQLQAEQSNLQSELAEMAQGEPPQGGEAPPPQAAEAMGAMEKAEQALGEMAQAPAAEAMEAALEALQEMQKGMESQLAAMQGQPGQPGKPMPGKPMPGKGESKEPPKLAVQDMSTTKNPKPPGELGADLKYGAKNTVRADGGWQVSLAPQEREALNNGAKEKFPQRYENDLTNYYRDLAAGAAVNP